MPCDTPVVFDFSPTWVCSGIARALLVTDVVTQTTEAYLACHLFVLLYTYGQVEVVVHFKEDLLHARNLENAFMHNSSVS